MTAKVIRLLRTRLNRYEWLAQDAMRWPEDYKLTGVTFAFSDGDTVSLSRELALELREYLREAVSNAQAQRPVVLLAAPEEVLDNSLVAD